MYMQKLVSVTHNNALTYNMLYAAKTFAPYVRNYSLWNAAGSH